MNTGNTLIMILSLRGATLQAHVPPAGDPVPWSRGMWQTPQMFSVAQCPLGQVASEGKAGCNQSLTCNHRAAGCLLHLVYGCGQQRVLFALR